MLCRAKLGMPAALLPVLNYVLLKFSRHVAHQLASSGYEVCLQLSQAEAAWTTTVHDMACS